MSDYQKALSQNTIQAFIDEKRKFRFKSSEYISTAWAEIQKDWGTSFITGLLLYFLGIVAPFLMAGIYIGKYKERKNGEKYEMGSLFKGFDHGMPIFMYLLITLGISMVIIFIPYILFSVFMALASESAIFIILALLMFIIMMIGAILMGTLFFFSIHFIVFAGMEAWPAMKASASIVRNNIGTTLSLVLTGAVVNIIGAMLCGVGMLITMPLVYMAYYYAFNDVFKVESSDGTSTDEILDHLV